MNENLLASSFKYLSQVLSISMNLISVEKLSYTMHDNPLFSDVTIGFDEGEKTGFIGKNGCGKTTFLRLLKGELLPDEGTVSRNAFVRIEFLSQHPSFSPGCTIRDFLYDGGGELPTLILEYKKCLEEYQHDHKGSRKLEELTARMDNLECWDMEKDYLSLLNELGIVESSSAMESLSGGMIKKIALARVLAIRPTFLILDEPTNHLDIKSIEWLEKYLAETRISFILVTHDRYFLDAACRTIVELDGGKFYRYQGNYSVYLEKREERIAAEKSEQNRIASVLRRELEWLKRGPKARTTKDRGRKQRIDELLEKRKTAEQDAADFSSTNSRLGKKILEVRDICKSYSGKEVIRPFTYSFKKGERIGLIGPNGSGKTTFLDLITSSVAPDSGIIDAGVNTKFGYYDQMSRPLLETCTVLEFIQKVNETVTLSDGTSVSAARFLEMFGFPVRYHRMELSRLSGGEKRRLYLIRVLSGNPNFLVMDEPTNDLDLETLRRLEDYILSFTGCVMIVSHDRAFLDRTTDYLFVFDGKGDIQGYTGSYTEYDDEVNEQNDVRHALKEERPLKERQTEKKKLSFGEKKEYEAILPAIDSLEAEKCELEKYFSAASPDPRQLAEKNIRYKKVLEEIEKKTRRWEELSEYV